MADDWLYRGLMAWYGWVNGEVNRDIMAPDMQLHQLQPANTDRTKSMVQCAVRNGGDNVRRGAVDLDDVTAHSYNGMCGTGTIYLRTSASGKCEAINPNAVSGLQSCGSAQLLYSEATPISLLWEPKLTLDNFDSEIRLVKFTLDSRDASDALYEWKASSGAPLLVYDPDRTGEIKSASQLFGSWSFGGRGGSKLDSNRQPWSDGYEALETQDVNGDGIVSGHELDSIALWFDHNRDAVSQPGEVIPAKRAGLVELFYKTPSEKQLDGSKHLNLGFRRKDGSGMLFSGASIDWTARAAEVGQTLYEKQLMQPGTSKSGTSSVQSASNATTATGEAPARSDRATPVKTGIAGYWRWVNGIADRPSSGILFLKANNDGSIEGSSVSESVLMNQAANDTVHAIRFVALQGALDQQDSSKVSFSMILPDNGNSAQSTATLVEQDGKSFLKGKTSVAVKKDNGAQQTISYDWIAERMTKDSWRWK